MKLFYADSQKQLDIDLSGFAPKLFFIGARIEARSHNKVLEIKGQCQFCNQPEPEFDFDFCCEASQDAARRRHESANLCDLCGLYSPNSATHSECHDRERAAGNWEEA